MNEKISVEIIKFILHGKKHEVAIPDWKLKLYTRATGLPKEYLEQNMSDEDDIYVLDENLKKIPVEDLVDYVMYREMLLEIRLEQWDNQLAILLGMLNSIFMGQASYKELNISPPLSYADVVYYEPEFEEL